MKSPLALLAIALLSLAVTACGGASKDASSASQGSRKAAASRGASASKTSSTTLGQRNLKGDYDEDDSVSNLDDTTNDAVRDNGNPANAVEKRAVTAAVKRYYAVAAAGDGAKACSMFVASLARAVPRDYGQASGPSYLRGGKTCQAVMSLLFKHFHTQLFGAIEVTGVLAKHNHALALLRSKTLPYKYISLDREGRVWKISELLGIELS